MKKIFALLTVAIALLPIFLFAQTTTTLAPAGAGAVSWLQHILDLIPSSVPAGILAILVFGVEIVMRVWPTVKPRSLFILVGQVMGAIGQIFVKISSLLDQVVQNLKD